MTAVIRPIGIDHTNFGDRVITVFADKVVTTETNIVLVHCQTVLAYEICQALFVEYAKTIEHVNFGGNIVNCF